MKLIFSLLSLLLSVSVWAQNEKLDKIFLKNGSVLDVSIKKVTPGTVEFTYPGEMVQNVENIDNVSSITFASGRVQHFNEDVSEADKTGNREADMKVKQNSLAILPVAFYEKKSGQLWEDHSKLAQSRIYVFFKDNNSKFGSLEIQDTRNTNAYLRKAGIDYGRLDETPVEELGKILGTEYLVLGKVTMDEKNNATIQQNAYSEARKDKNKSSGATYSSARIEENKTYNYVVVLEIYKGKEKIYSETRKPFLQMEDSWKDAMEYMLKRTPIYKKK